MSSPPIVIMTKHSTLTSVLLLISLLAVAAGSLLGLVEDTIVRLPSAGAGEMAEEVHWDTTPWKCCDYPFCSLKPSPRCSCLDPVESCDGCANCTTWPSPPTLSSSPAAAGTNLVCEDWYTTYAPPRCTQRERPWTCCDDPACTTTCPTLCECRDVVESCASTCKFCQKVKEDPPRYQCQDMYFGSPWPRCSSSAARA